VISAWFLSFSFPLLSLFYLDFSLFIGNPLKSLMWLALEQDLAKSINNVLIVLHPLLMSDVEMEHATPGRTHIYRQ
jgi:hypothetical protein